MLQIPGFQVLSNFGFLAIFSIITLPGLGLTVYSRNDKCHQSHLWIIVAAFFFLSPFKYFQRCKEKNTLLGSFLFPLFCSVLGHQVEPVVHLHRSGCLLLRLKQTDVWQNKFFKSNKIKTNYTHKQNLQNNIWSRKTFISSSLVQHSF